MRGLLRSADDDRKGVRALIWDYMLHGMAAGFWLLGLLLVIGLFAGLVTLIIAAVGHASGEDERTWRG